MSSTEIETRANSPAKSLPKAAAKSDAPKGGARANASRGRIIDAALELFSTCGYDGTSIRDIASAVGMTTASLYYHFSSKEELFVIVHGLSLDAVMAAVLRAVDGIDDPWDRLEAAAEAHCATLFETDGTRAILTARLSDGLTAVTSALVAQRDAYDGLIQRLVDDLALPTGVDRRLLRLHILGVMNFLPTWFRRDGRLSAGEVGREMVRHLRFGLEQKTSLEEKTLLAEKKSLEPKTPRKTRRWVARGGRDQQTREDKR
jgi:TetR/AcrR family transcriptional regulator, cholesterol catabolism regulator